MKNGKFHCKDAFLIQINNKINLTICKFSIKNSEYVGKIVINVINNEKKHYEDFELFAI